MEKVGKTLFIVEDEKVTAKNLESLLTRLGYSVAGIAPSGEEALEKIPDTNADLVLMDIILQGEMDGIEAASQVLERFDLPVIYTTAHTDEATFEKVKLLGNPYGYVIKPYNSEEMKAAIEVAIVRHAYDRKISASEMRYKLLVEGTNDIIFSMNDRYEFITVNNAIKEHLNLSIETVIGKSIFDLLFVSPGSDQGMAKIFEEKLSQMLNEQKPMQIKMQFGKKTFMEMVPYEMTVRMEVIRVRDKSEILGKAFKPQGDNLMKYLVAESRTMSIENDIMLVKEIVDRITRELIRFTDEKKIINVKIALRELLINAIEHGNLNISYAEKTEALMQDTYIQLLSERQMRDSNSDKIVGIIYSIDKDKVSYTITDQGNGFDYNALLEKLSKADACADDAELHGRGLIMALKIFDSLIFNELGNEVTGILKF